MKTLFKHLRSAHSRGQISEESALCLGHLTNGDGKYYTEKILKGFVDLIKLVSINSNLKKRFRTYNM